MKGQENLHTTFFFFGSKSYKNSIIPFFSNESKVSYKSKIVKLKGIIE